MQVNKLIGNIANWIKTTINPDIKNEEVNCKNKKPKLAKHEDKKLTKSTYNAIDLGLSVKWAIFNVGATKPVEVGSYYAWGETEEKEYYDEDNYKYLNKEIGENICGTKYDIAYVKWGGNWRMPTAEEDAEFEDCIQEWCYINKVKGLKITGPNGNSIFLPTTGIKMFFSISGDFGHYWLGDMSDDFTEEGMTGPNKLTFDHDVTLDSCIFGSVS